MNQVIVGVFASYRDGHEALRALQLAGLKRDDAHLYRAGQTDAMPFDDEGSHAMEGHREDEAEYAAHGEHQGVVGARNRFSPGSMKRPEPLASDDAQTAECRERTLLVIKLSDDIKPGPVGEVLHEHGAIAVKDGAGHWRFSPYRNNVRTPR
ncbi:hypothetical protein AWB68_01475 [Caballeronia choica]|uniref:Uncharacterized protein n=1 Tax=Caballeronia choica TaxID=326476 RepID=A0A158GCF8_9BURK|nr:hypothetical protein [Caballeronia choica]SAL29593.1 hypothetical protein AWB68_01475 [Caballeronia choica]